MKCIDAFKNLNILNYNNALSVSPCCISHTRPAESIDFQNNDYLNDVRETWKLGEFPAACQVCRHSEVTGTSRRIGVNEWYENNGYNNTTVELVKLDYWTGDICNLRCAICGPKNSSAWKEELKLPVKQSVVNRFWTTLDLSTLRFVHFNGGEPLLSKEHVVFLKDLPNKNLVTINYNTNGTVKPSAELLELWQQFHLVQLDFSIDDIEERFEYQRYPARWSEVTDNLKWYIDNSPTNCMFAVNTSVGILNYANLINLNSWLRHNFAVSRVGDAIEHRQQPVNGIFSLDNAVNRQKSIVKFLDDCDSRRGTNWRTVFPELVQSI